LTPAIGAIAGDRRERATGRSAGSPDGARAGFSGRSLRARALQHRVAMKTALTTFTAVLSLAAVHCSSSNSGTSGSGGTGSASLATSPADFCHAACTRVNACDSTSDVDTCAGKCSNDLASVFPKLRDDFVSNVEHCWQQKDCRNVLDSSSAFSSCVDEAEESIAPTQAGTSFCDGLDKSWKKCSLSLDRSKCLGLVKEYNDTALGAATNCLDKSCSDVDDCVSAALDLATGGSPAPSASSSGGPAPSGSGSGSSPPPAPPGH
jgi:hypothetical protein